MTKDSEEYQSSLAEIRMARDEAEGLRDQLLAEYERICQDVVAKPADRQTQARQEEGRETMRKAIAAANRAIESIDQALRELERVQDDPGQ